MQPARVMAARLAIMMAMKTSMKPSLSRLIDVRGLRYHVREWGRPGMRPLFMLHGWADVSATF